MSVPATRMRPAPTPGPRARCDGCLRAQAACWCRFTRPTDSRTRVCFLQHPRERDRAIGTAWIAHRSLPNSEVHVGTGFEEHARIQALLAEPGTALLFPGPGAQDPGSVQPPPKTLIVVDGTWSQARKLVRLNPALQRLPRIGFTPRQPSRYRIRKEPAEHCVSTIEAVVHVLSALEHDEQRFQPILRAFDRMVDYQLECTASRPGPPRRRVKGPPRPRDDGLGELRARAADAVALYGEVNAHARDSGVPGAAELIHLVALRLATGERFEAVIAPRRPLAPRSPDHLRVPAARLLAGEPVSAALSRFAGFLRASDVYVGWGEFTAGVIDAGGAADAGGALDAAGAMDAGGALDAGGEPSQRPALERPYFDLRPAMMRRLQRNPGGLDGALAAMGLDAPLEPLGEGRAGARLAALARLASTLLAS